MSAGLMLLAFACWAAAVVIVWRSAGSRSVPG